MEKAFRAYEDENKAGIAIRISDKIYLKTMTLRRDKECQDMRIEPSKMKLYM